MELYNIISFKLIFQTNSLIMILIIYDQFIIFLNLIKEKMIILMILISIIAFSIIKIIIQILTFFLDLTKVVKFLKLHKQ